MPDPGTSGDAPDAAHAATVAATSAPVTVYTLAASGIEGSLNCAKPARPVCHIKLTFVFRVPLSAVKTEISKHLFAYSGLTLSATTGPPSPATLALSSAPVSKVRKIAPREFELTVPFAFKVGNDGFSFSIAGCLQDTEPKDGLNLPGHHHCGNTTIPGNVFFLG